MSKIIHQMWLDKIVNDNLGPPEKYSKYLKYMESWKKFHQEPEWKYIFWNADKINNLWKEDELKKYEKFYHNLSHHLEKCDFARYAILYIYGGIYVDLDFQCFRTFDFVGPDMTDFYLVSEPEEHKKNLSSNLCPIANGILISVKKHPFWLSLMDNIIENYDKKGNVVKNTGPERLAIFLSSSAPALEYQKNILPSCQFIPLTQKGKFSKFCSNTSPIYSSTNWTEGTGWFDLRSYDYLIIIGILFIIFIMLLFLYRRKSKLTSK